MLEKIRRTKIVTTLGPATDRDNNLEKILVAGANVVRLNFSHGSPEDHINRANETRRLARKLNKQVAILGDLQGPKIRVSTFKDGKITLKVGAPFILDANLSKGAGTEQAVGIDYPNLVHDVAPGDLLLLDDGRVQLSVERIVDSQIFTTVTIGGPLSNNKGINKLGGGLSAEALTEKDKIDIVTAAKIDVDYLAVSFPRNGADLHYARRLMREAGSDAKIVAKVERAEAVQDDEAMDDIIRACDVVMVARGDLGVEIGDAELVGVQKRLIRRSRSLNRAVITATQMMESMINSPMPTRAEVMDVANAVLDGTDAVMLSAETASGQYPEAVVASMARVCVGAEKVPSTKISTHRMSHSFDTVEETIAMSAMFAANHMKNVSAIVALTESGQTALILSRISSGLPIFALSENSKTLQLCALYRGVTPVFLENGEQGAASAQHALQLLKKEGWLSAGETVILTQGDKIGKVGGTNSCKAMVVE